MCLYGHLELDIRIEVPWIREKITFRGWRFNHRAVCSARLITFSFCGGAVVHQDPTHRQEWQLH